MTDKVTPDQDEWSTIIGGKKIKGGGRPKPSRNGKTHKHGAAIAEKSNSPSIDIHHHSGPCCVGDEAKFHFAAREADPDTDTHTGRSNGRRAKKRSGRWKGETGTDLEDEDGGGGGDAHASVVLLSAVEKEANGLVREFERLRKRWDESDMSRWVDEVLEKRYREDGTRMGAVEGGEVRAEIEQAGVTGDVAVSGTDTINHAFCIATGSFSQNWQHRMRGMWQLIMFLACVKKVTALQNGIAPRLYAQEPRYDETDVLFLGKLGIQVLVWSDRSIGRKGEDNHAGDVQSTIATTAIVDTRVNTTDTSSLSSLIHPTDAHPNNDNNNSSRKDSEGDDVPAPVSAEDVYHHRDENGNIHSRTFLFAPFLQWTVLIPSFLMRWDGDGDGDGGGGAYVATVPRLYVGIGLANIGDSIRMAGWEESGEDTATTTTTTTKENRKGGEIETMTGIDHFDGDGGNPEDWRSGARLKRKQKKIQSQARRRRPDSETAADDSNRDTVAVTAAAATTTTTTTTTTITTPTPESHRSDLAGGLETGAKKEDHPVLLPLSTTLGRTRADAALELIDRFERGGLCQRDRDGLPVRDAADAGDVEGGEGGGQGWRRLRVLESVVDELPKFELDNHALNGLVIVHSF